MSCSWFCVIFPGEFSLQTAVWLRAALLNLLNLDQIGCTGLHDWKAR